MYVVVPITRKEPGIDIVSLMLPIVIERLIELILPVVIVLFAVNVTFPVKIESPTTNNLDFKYKSKLLLLLVILLLDIVNGVTEINDDNIPSERGFLTAGVFNAGFFMLKNTSNVLSFLNWWMLRMKNQ